MTSLDADAPTLLTGASSSLGRRVATRLSADGIDVLPLSLPDQAALRDGPQPAARCLIHLLSGDHDALANRRLNAVEVAEDALAVATARGVTHVVLLSSAMVYGAWPNNPVPLTEESPLRPNFGFDYARQLGQVEYRLDRWRVAMPGRTVCVLRPALSMAAGGAGTVVRALAAGMGMRVHEHEAPAQFLHLDDLASAIALAHQRQLDGVFNVAPDGFVASETVRALSGSGSLRLPARVAYPIAALRWRFQRGPLPPGLLRYVRYPWIVANDRIKAAGWMPTSTNEQVYVEGTEAKWWTMLTPKRKQELALGGSGVAVLVAGLVLTLLVRRAKRARR
jgi:nucleoside-diphosphate-sugar epimerase